MPVEPVDDEELRLLDPPLAQRRRDPLGQALLPDSWRWRGENPRHLVHDDDLAVLVDDPKSRSVARLWHRPVAAVRIEPDFDNVPGLAPLTVRPDRAAVDGDAPLVDESLGDRVGHTHTVVQDPRHGLTPVRPRDLEIPSFHRSLIPDRPAARPHSPFPLSVSRRAVSTAAAERAGFSGGGVPAFRAPGGQPAGARGGSPHRSRILACRLNARVPLPASPIWPARSCSYRSPPRDHLPSRAGARPGSVRVFRART